MQEIKVFILFYLMAQTGINPGGIVDSYRPQYHLERFYLINRGSVK